MEGNTSVEIICVQNIVFSKYFSLVKMLCTFSKKSGKCPSVNELEHSVKRNFGGYVTVDDPEPNMLSAVTDPLDVFRRHLGQTHLQQVNTVSLGCLFTDNI